MSTLRLQIRASADELPLVHAPSFDASTTKSTRNPKQIWFRVVSPDLFDSAPASKWHGEVATAFVTDQDFRKLQTLRVVTEQIRVIQQGYAVSTLVGVP